MGTYIWKLFLGSERAVTSGINISLNYGYLKSSITLKLTVYLKIWTLIYENLAFEHAVTSRVNDFWALYLHLMYISNFT